MDNLHDDNRVVRTGAFDLPIPRREAFPLFGPDREGDWAWGWQPEPVYPNEIRAEDGAVFLTDHGGFAVWVISRYEPESGLIEYTTFRPGDRVGRVSVHVSDNDSGSTVDVTYTFTALSDQGRRHIAHFTAQHYAEMMAEWQTVILHFLSTGETLRR